MSEQPNVLMICTDHWPASLLGVAGAEHIMTPTLDVLANSGVRYTNCYSECPVCIPARRSMMTGLSPKTHDDRIYKDRLEMPDVPLLAQCFRDAGYQAFASGKLHVYPQRNRIGFDDVMLGEEGRIQFGCIDDYEMFLADQGYAGRQFEHTMGNNCYETRPWHLPDECHPTEWTTRQMVRFIKRRDPRKPGFYYLSYCHPHPPLIPLRDYLQMYQDTVIPDPVMGDWASDPEQLPAICKLIRNKFDHQNPQVNDLAVRAFYALCTHIDHQIRYVIGTLREEGLLGNTIIMFTSDHGDMLGNHGLWAKRVMYESAANVPMILSGEPVIQRVGHHRKDDRLVAWRDIMPTLLDLAGLAIPSTVEGLSMVGDQKRQWLYGEVSEGLGATRMIHDGRFKLIWYPVGNVRQLFDLQEDPQECRDLSGSQAHAGVLDRLTDLLVKELYGEDEACVVDGRLVGRPDEPIDPAPNVALSGQRGLHFP